MTRIVAQLVVGVIAILGGAWLIGWWAVGVVLVVFGVSIALDALVREDDRDDKRQFHNDVLERWRRAR
jgi:fatty acid desaturase